MIALFLAMLLSTPDVTVCRIASENRLVNLSGEDQLERFALCLQIASKARQRNLPVPLIVELSWRESNWTHVTNTASGCTGPLQASPKYWCPNGTAEGCDLVDAGLDAFEHYAKQHPNDMERTVCHYASGRKCSPKRLRRSQEIVRRVNGIYSRERRQNRARNTRLAK